MEEEMTTPVSGYQPISDVAMKDTALPESRLTSLKRSVEHVAQKAFQALWKALEWLGVTLAVGLASTLIVQRWVPNGSILTSASVSFIFGALIGVAVFIGKNLSDHMHSKTVQP
jgi:hypothetical protein